MTIWRKVIIVSLIGLLLICTLLQSWNVGNLANNKWLENGMDITIGIIACLAAATAPKKSN
jgi:hypothetical protein